jgi:hypothetical protein
VLTYGDATTPTAAAAPVATKRLREIVTFFMRNSSGVSALYAVVVILTR